MRFFQRHEEGVIVQPGGVFGAERVEGFLQRRLRVRREADESPFEQVQLPGDERAKVNTVRREVLPIRQIVRREQAIFQQ